MANTLNLKLGLVPNGTSNISAAYNEAMKIIDAIVQCRIVDKDLTAPPATVDGDAGKCWIPAAGATGAWAGHVGEIALCTAANQWQFIVPLQGWRCYMIDEDVYYKRGAAAWAIWP